MTHELQQPVEQLENLVMQYVVQQPSNEMQQPTIVLHFVTVILPVVESVKVQLDVAQRVRVQPVVVSQRFRSSLWKHT